MVRGKRSRHEDCSHLCVTCDFFPGPLTLPPFSNLWYEREGPSSAQAADVKGLLRGLGVTVLKQSFRRHPVATRGIAKVRSWREKSGERLCSRKEERI